MKKVIITIVCLVVLFFVGYKYYNELKNNI